MNQRCRGGASGPPAACRLPRRGLSPLSRGTAGAAGFLLVLMPLQAARGSPTVGTEAETLSDELRISLSPTQPTFPMVSFSNKEMYYLCI